MTTVSAEALTLEGLITIDQDVEPYILQWPGTPEEDGVIEVFVLPGMKRPDGVM